MEEKTPSSTAIHDHTYRIFPSDLNIQGTIFGELIMAEADRLAHIVAERHSGRICVTASVDSIQFHAPAGMEIISYLNLRLTDPGALRWRWEQRSWPKREQQ